MTIKELRRLNEARRKITEETIRVMKGIGDKEESIRRIWDYIYCATSLFSDDTFTRKEERDYFISYMANTDFIVKNYEHECKDIVGGVVEVEESIYYRIRCVVIEICKDYDSQYLAFE